MVSVRRAPGRRKRNGNVVGNVVGSVDHERPKRFGGVVGKTLSEASNMMAGNESEALSETQRCGLPKFPGPAKQHGCRNRAATARAVRRLQETNPYFDLSVR